MKVLFKKDVPDVAQDRAGKDVADGYARNFLMPRGLAVAARATLKQVAELQAVAARHATEEEQAARTLKTKLEAQPVVVEAKAGQQGRLYGSITTTDVATAIQKQLGTSLDRRDLDIPRTGSADWLVHSDGAPAQGGHGQRDCRGARHRQQLSRRTTPMAIERLDTDLETLAGADHRRRHATSVCRHTACRPRKRCSGQS